MADAVIISRQTKVETDAFRMPNMQVAIRLGGKTGFDAPAPFTAPVILFNDVADEVGSSGGSRVGINVICQEGLSNLQSRHYSANDALFTLIRRWNSEELASASSDI